MGRVPENESLPEKKEPDIPSDGLVFDDVAWFYIRHRKKKGE